MLFNAAEIRFEDYYEWIRNLSPSEMSHHKKIHFSNLATVTLFS